jgi:ribosomal protein S18 acetylase RimI-like enzyme
MKVILCWLEEHYPERPIWLSVFSNNLKAQKFYNHYSFYKVGEYNYPVGECKNDVFIMKREIVT